ncbi:MAG: hypothetical protein ACFFA0_04835 [Promethearchaeota archaeon]
MNKKSRRYVIITCLILVLSIQNWHSLHYVISCHQSRVSMVTISSDDPFFGDEPINAEKNVTLYLTDKFSVKGIAYHRFGRLYHTYVHLNIYDPNNNLTYSDSKRIRNSKKTQFEFSDIELNPHIFKLLGKYKLELYLSHFWNGIIKVSSINTSYFVLEREIVDLYSYFIDNIYLQTESTPFHHEIFIYGKAFEAGENIPFINQLIKIFWKEINGSSTQIGEFYSDDSGLISANFTRYNTLHQSQMQCYLIYEGNDVYQPSDSRNPSPFINEKEQNKYVIKNANEHNVEYLEFPETYGYPSKITLSNKESTIWSPKGDDNDIENWNFKINPFIDPNLNTIGYQGEKGFDGYDYWISSSNGIIPNNTGPKMVDEDYRISLAPISLDTLKGSTDFFFNLNELLTENYQGIRFIPAYVEIGNKSYYESKIRYYYHSNFSLNQIENLVFHYCFKEVDIQYLNYFSLSISDGLKEIDLVGKSKKESDLSGIIEFGKFPFSSFYLYVEVTFNFNVTYEDSSLCDVLYFELDPIENSVNKYLWTQNYLNNSNSITFQCFGGIEQNEIIFNFATEVFIPSVPFYNYYNTISSIKLDLIKQGIFKVEIGLNFTIQGFDLTQFIIPIKEINPNDFNTENLILDLDMTDYIQEYQDKLFYFGLYIKVSRINLGEDFRCDVHEIEMTADYIRDDDAPSIIENYKEELTSEEGVYHPISVDYDFVPDEIILINQLNQTLDNEYGSIFQNFQENPGDSYHLYNGSAIEEDFNGDNNTDYLLSSCQMVIPFNSQPEIYAINDNQSIITTGSLDENVFLTNDIKYQLFSYRSPNGTIKHTEIVKESLYEFSINASNIIDPNYYSILKLTTELIVSIPISQEINSIDLSKNVYLRLFFLRGGLAPEALSYQNSYNISILYIDEIDFNTYDYQDYNSVGFEERILTINFEENKNYTHLNFPINNEFVNAINTNREFLTFRINFDINSTIAQNTTLYLSDYNYLNDNQELFSYNIIPSYYEFHYYPDFHVVYNLVLDDLSYLPYINVSYNLQLMKGTLSLAILSQYSEIDIICFNSSDEVLLKEGLITINNYQFFDKNTIKLKLSYKGLKFYDAINGFSINELSIKYHKLNSYFSINPYYKDFWGYQIHLDGTIMKNSPLYGLIGIDNNLSITSLINLNKEIFDDYDPKSNILSPDYLNPVFNDSYVIDINIISLKDFQILISNISLFGGWQKLNTFMEQKGPLFSFFDFGAIVSLNYFQLYYLVELDQQVRIINISTQKYLTPYWDYIFDCEGKGEAFYEGWHLNIPLDLNNGENVSARYIRIEYEIIRGTSRRLTPLVQKALISACRTKVGNLEGLIQGGDGKELIFGLVDEKLKEFTFTFVIDKSHEEMPFLILSQDYIYYPEFTDFPGLLLDEYKVAIINPDSGIIKYLDFKLRFQPEMDGVLVDDIFSYLDDSGRFFLRFFLKSDFEINFHLDFLAGSFYDNATSLLNLPYVFRMELERASGLAELSPSSVEKWEGLGTYDLNRETTTAYETDLNIIDDQFILSRDMKDYFGEEISGGNIEVTNGKTSLDNLYETKKIDIRDPFDFDCLSYKYITTTFKFLWWKLVIKRLRVVGSDDDNSISVTYQIDIPNYYINNRNIKIVVSAYSFTRCRNIIFNFGTILYDTQIQIYSGDKEYTTSDFIPLESKEITIKSTRGSFPLETFFFQEIQQFLYISDVRVIIQNELNLLGGIDGQGNIACETELFIKTGLLLDELDYAVLSGTLIFSGQEKRRYIYFPANFSSSINVKFQYLDFDKGYGEWVDFSFPNAKIKNDYGPFEKPGFNQHTIPFSYALISGGYKYKLPKHIFYEDPVSSWALAKIKAIVTFHHEQDPKLMPKPSYIYGNVDLDYVVKASWKNIKVRLLYTDQKLIGKNEYTEKTFGIRFDITEKDIEEFFERDFDPKDAWYFGTYFDFSIYPHWSNDAYSNTQKFDDTDLLFNTWLGVEKYYNKSDETNQDTYIEVIELPLQYQNFQILDLSKKAFEIVFTESEDRVSVIDPNALRLSSPDIDDYFIKDGFGQQSIRFYLNITVKFQTASQLNYRKWSEPNVKKRITVRASDITVVDVMKEIEYESHFDNIPLTLSIPEPRSKIFEKVTSVKITMEGILSLSSFEIYHTLSDAIGFNVMLKTQSGGLELLKRISLNKNSSNEFTFEISIPVMKLDDNEKITLLIQFGVFDFFFIGLYNDFGYLFLQFNRISVEYLYSSGFSDSLSGEAYVDKVIEFNIGFDLQDENVSAIVVHTNIDYCMQFVTASYNGIINEYGTEIIPQLFIFNYRTTLYEPMICYSEQTNVFDFVVDDYNHYLNQYSENGQMKFIFILNGKDILDNIGLDEVYSYAHLIINSLEIELIEEIEEYPQSKSSQTIHASGDLLKFDDWALYKDIYTNETMPYNLRYKFSFLEDFDEKKYVNISLDFVNEICNGLYEDYYAILDENRTFVEGQLTNYIVNDDGLIIQANLILILNPNYNGEYYLYWSDLKNFIHWEIKVDISNMTEYTGNSYISTIQDYYNYNPYTFEVSDSLWKLNSLDSQFYSIPGVNGEADHLFEFDFSDLNYELQNITGISFKLIEISEFSNSLYLKAFDFGNADFKTYFLKNRSVDEFYFKEYEHKIALIHLNPEDIFNYLTSDLKLIVEIGSNTLNEQNFTWNVNLMEIDILYNQGKSSEVNADYTPYIVDQNFIDSIDFYDIFSQVDLEGWFGDICDFKVKNGYLTKYPSSPKKCRGPDGCYYSWRCSKPSYLLVDYDDEDYYVDFLVNIQDTYSHYKTVEWLVHGNKKDHKCKTSYTGLLFQLHAYQSADHHANELHIWKKESWGNYWRHIDSIKVPIHIDVEKWYKITTYVNKSYISIKINGTGIYSNYINTNVNSGCFGIRSSYYEQYFIDNVILSKKEFTGENIRDYFADFSVNITDGMVLKYGDQIEVNFSYIPEGFEDELKDHKFNLLVNSSDGWLLLDEALTNQNGSTVFNIDSVDLETFDIIGDYYSKYIDYRDENDTREYFFIENFEEDLDKWTSNHINDFTIDNGYLEKDGYIDRESYIITNPEHPSNYTIAFDALMNIDPSREKFDWIVESDDDFHKGYMYRLYSSTSNEYPNILRLYQKKYDNSYKIINEIEVTQEIFTGEWYHLEIDIYEDTEKVYHRIRFNDEQIFSYVFTQEEYNHKNYFGFRIYNTNQSIVDNVQLYNGTYNIETRIFNPVEIDNNNLNHVVYNNVKYDDNGINRIENLIITEKSYNLINNEASLGLELNFTYLLNEYGQQFNLDSFYGIKIGVLLPYDLIISEVEVSLFGGNEESIKKTFNYQYLSKIYSTSDDCAVIINNTRMIKTDLVISLLEFSNVQLAKVNYLNIKTKRSPIEFGEYQGERIENLVGISSLQLVKQLNNYSITGFNFENSPLSTLGIYYEGSGKIYSSLKILNNVIFERTETNIMIFDGPSFSVKYGGNFKIPIAIINSQTNTFLPFTSPICYSSFLLMIKKKKEWIVYGFEKLNMSNYDLNAYSNYICDMHPLLSGGIYTDVSILWIGNGLFKPTQTNSEQFESLEVTPVETSINLTIQNMEIKFGHTFEITGTISDGNDEVIKDLNLIPYSNEFSSNETLYIEFSNIPFYSSDYYDDRFYLNAHGQPGAYFRFLPLYDPQFDKLNMKTDYVNLFHMIYKSNSTNLKIKVNLELNNSLTFSKSLKIENKDSWIELFMDVKPEDGNIYIITNYSIQIESLTNENFEFIIDYIQFEHFIPVYLQIFYENVGWKNLALTKVEVKDFNSSEFRFKLYSESEQYLLNNIFREYLYNRPIYNNSLYSGDYKCRIFFPAIKKYYQNSSKEFFLRVNPVETAIFYQKDSSEQITKDGFYNEREYSDTSIFALEAGKPYTFLELGYTWGDNRTINFILSEKDASSIKGIPNKPLWFQIGIVPNSYLGLDERSYLADYYPMTRDIRTSELFENVFFIQDKYSRPILYDYYDLEKDARSFYGPMLWQIIWTDENGIVSFNTSITYYLFEYLRTIFSTRDLECIEIDLYIRVFYNSHFSWKEMSLPIVDKLHGNEPILCSYNENLRASDLIFDADDAEEKIQETSTVFYYDPIYSSCYAEGLIEIYREGLVLEGNYMEVTLTGTKHDQMTFVCQLNEAQRADDGSSVPEDSLEQNEWNKFDELQAYYFITNPSMTEILIGDPESNPMPALKIDESTGQVIFHMNSSTVVLEEWNNIIPGYYKVLCIIPKSIYYKQAEVDFTLLVKSPATFNFAEPSTHEILSNSFEENSEVFLENVVTDKIITNFTYTNVYPVLNGTIWMDPSNSSDGATAIILINNFPVYRRTIYPNEAYPILYPLDIFDNSETFTISLITYSDERKLEEIDFEDPIPSETFEDRIHFDLYITHSTFDNPYAGRGEIFCNITQIIEENVDFDLYQGNNIVELHHIVTNDGEGNAFKIEKSFTPIFGDTRYGVLLHPEGEEYLTKVIINMHMWDTAFKIEPITDLIDCIYPSKLKEGWQYELNNGFTESIRRIEFTNPLNESEVINGIRIFSLDSFKTYLTFLSTYLPYEGFIEGGFYLTRPLSAGEKLELSIATMLNTAIDSILWNITLDSTSSRLVEFNFSTFDKYKSEFYDLTFTVEGVNIDPSNSIAVNLFDAKIRGFEDTLTVSTDLPFGRAALFSNNFLYYFLRDQEEIGLSEDDTDILIQLEDHSDEQKLGYQNFFDLSQYLEIYENVQVNEFQHDPQDGSIPQDEITNHNDSQIYSFPADRPDEGIFVRTQIFNIFHSKYTESHCGYVVMYKPAEDPEEQAVELGRRKVTIFVRPKEWSIKPQDLQITFNNLSNSFNIYLDGDRIETSSYVDSNYIQLEYGHPSHKDDLIWNKCNLEEFEKNWNKSKYTDVGYDLIDNGHYFTVGSFDGKTEVSNFNIIDFSPEEFNDWTNFEFFQTNILVNDSSFIEDLSVKIYDRNSGIHEKIFPITESFTDMPIKWDLRQMNTQNELTDVEKVELVLNANFSRKQDLQINSSDVYFETRGIALQNKNSYTELIVNYKDDPNDYIISEHLDRTFFEGKDTLNSFKCDKDKIIERLILRGTTEIKVNLFSVDLYQNLTISEEKNLYFTDKLYSLEFDINQRNTLDEYYIAQNTEPFWWTYECIGCSEEIIESSSLELLYQDYDKDGSYDRMDMYEDYAGGIYGDGINDQHSIDFDADGEFDEIISRTMSFTTKNYEDAGIIIRTWQNVDTKTKIFCYDGVNNIVSRSEKIFLKEYRNGIEQPYVNVIRQTIYDSNMQRPDIIIEHRDEWRLNNGTDDFETHFIQTWNVYTEEYDIQYWHDWAVVLDITLLGEKVSGKYPVSTNIHGIEDKGVHSVPINPGIPIASEAQETTGTFIWVNSHNLTEHSYGWDMAFVVVDNNTVDAKFSGLRNPNTMLAIAVVLDSNQDHVYQREKMDDNDDYFDQFLPLWMAAPDNNLRQFIKELAYSESWNDWITNMEKPSTLVKIIVEVALTFIITMAVAAALSWLGGPLILAGLIASFLVYAVMTFMGPWIDELFDPTGVAKSKNAKHNQDILMKTKVPKQSGIVTHGETPKWNYIYWESRFEGWELAVYGSFGINTRLKTDPCDYGFYEWLWDKKTEEKAYSIPGKIFAIDPEAPQVKQPDEIIEMIMSNPVGILLMIFGVAPTPFPISDVYENYESQKEVLERAYERALGYNEDPKDSMKVRIIPYMMDGKPTFLAIADDQISEGRTQFWREDTQVWQQIEHSFLLLCVRYKAYYTSNPDVIFWDTVVTVAKIALCALASWAGMGVGAKIGGSIGGSKVINNPAHMKLMEGYKGGAWSLIKSALHSMFTETLEEIFIDEFLLNNFIGGAIDRFLLRREIDFEIWGMRVGDLLEWGYAFADSFQNYASYTNTVTDAKLDSLKKELETNGKLSTLKLLRKYALVMRKSMIGAMGWVCKQVTFIKKMNVFKMIRTHLKTNHLYKTLQRARKEFYAPNIKPEDYHAIDLSIRTKYRELIVDNIDLKTGDSLSLGRILEKLNKEIKDVGWIQKKDDVFFELYIVKKSGEEIIITKNDEQNPYYNMDAFEFFMTCDIKSWSLSIPTKRQGKYSALRAARLKIASLIFSPEIAIQFVENEGLNSEILSWLKDFIGTLQSISSVKLLDKLMSGDNLKDFLGDIKEFLVEAKEFIKNFPQAKDQRKQYFNNMYILLGKFGKLLNEILTAKGVDMENSAILRFFKKRMGEWTLDRRQVGDHTLYEKISSGQSFANLIAEILALNKPLVKVLNKFGYIANLPGLKETTLKNKNSLKSYILTNMGNLFEYLALKSLQKYLLSIGEYQAAGQVELIYKTTNLPYGGKPLDIVIYKILETLKQIHVIEQDAKCTLTGLRESLEELKEGEDITFDNYLYLFIKHIIRLQLAADHNYGQRIELGKDAFNLGQDAFTLIPMAISLLFPIDLASSSESKPKDFVSAFEFLEGRPGLLANFERFVEKNKRQIGWFSISLGHFIEYQGNGKYKIITGITEKGNLKYYTWRAMKKDQIISIIENEILKGFDKDIINEIKRKLETFMDAIASNPEMFSKGTIFLSGYLENIVDSYNNGERLSLPIIFSLGYSPTQNNILAATRYNSIITLANYLYREAEIIYANDQTGFDGFCHRLVDVVSDILQEPIDIDWIIKPQYNATYNII